MVDSLWGRGTSYSRVRIIIKAQGETRGEKVGYALPVGVHTTKKRRRPLRPKFGRQIMGGGDELLEG